MFVNAERAYIAALREHLQLHAVQFHGDEAEFAADAAANQEYGLLRNVESPARVELLQGAMQTAIS